MFHASSAPHTGAGRRERGAQRHAFSAFGAEMLRGDRKKGHEMQRGHGPQHDEMMRAADLPRGHDGNCKKRRRGGEECKKAPRRRPWPPPREEQDCRSQLRQQEDVERTGDRHFCAEYPLDDGHAAEGRGIKIPHLRGLLREREHSRIAEDVELRGAADERHQAPYEKRRRDARNQRLPRPAGAEPQQR